jgi:hypothetical protein
MIEDLYPLMEGSRDAGFRDPPPPVSAPPADVIDVMEGALLSTPLAQPALWGPGTTVPGINPGGETKLTPGGEMVVG